MPFVAVSEQESVNVTHTKWGLCSYERLVPDNMMGTEVVSQSHARDCKHALDASVKHTGILNCPLARVVGFPSGH